MDYRTNLILRQYYEFITLLSIPENHIHIVKINQNKIEVHLENESFIKEIKNE